MVPEPCAAVYPLGPCFPLWGYSSVSSMSSEETNSNCSRFPLKLHDLLSWAETTGESSIVWVTNKAFIVKDQERFSSIVLPAFFNTRTWKSFTRQLNTYKFMKVQQGPLKGAYGHPLFIRGNLDSCRLMVTYQSTEDAPPSSFYNEIDDYNVMSLNQAMIWQRILRSPAHYAIPHIIQQSLGEAPRNPVPLINNPTTSSTTGVHHASGAVGQLPTRRTRVQAQEAERQSESFGSSSINMESSSLRGASTMASESSLLAHQHQQTISNHSSLRRTSDHSIEFEGRSFFPVLGEGDDAVVMIDDDAVITSMDSMWDNLPTSEAEEDNKPPGPPPQER